jgi:hypothetical protein
MVEQKKFANDPVPAKAIRLGEAYERVLEAIKDHPEVLNTLDEFIRETLSINRELMEEVDSATAKSHQRKEATVFFRACLRAGELRTFIRDPETGETLELDNFDWQPISGHKFWPLRLPDHLDDFVRNDDPAVGNPNTFIRGAFRPVFLWRVEFERWLKEKFGVRRHAGGRPKGAGSLEAADRPLLRKMHQLLKSHEAKSVHDAARLVAEEAKGSREFVSKQTRLAKRYRLLYPSERN